MTNSWDGNHTTVTPARKGRHRRPSTIRFGFLRAALDLDRPAVSGQHAAQPRETPPATGQGPAT